MKPTRAPHKQFDASGKRIPIRTCVVCRVRSEQSLVLRLGRDQAGLFQPDPQRRMVGRGVYVCSSEACHTPKALMRLARTDAPRLARLLEIHFKPS